MFELHSQLTYFSDHGFRRIINVIPITGIGELSSGIQSKTASCSTGSQAEIAHLPRWISYCPVWMTSQSGTRKRASFITRGLKLVIVSVKRTAALPNFMCFLDTYTEKTSYCIHGYFSFLLFSWTRSAHTHVLDTAALLNFVYVWDSCATRMLYPT